MMATSYRLLMICVLMLSGTYLFAQKQRFDVISFVIPKGWQQQQNEGGMQLSITDKKTGAYAIAAITKANASTASATENFNNDWQRLVIELVQVNAEPAMQDPLKENGWDIISGSANFTDGANTGMATLLTATGGGQSASVVLMTNARQYQDDLLAFLNSLELPEISQGEKTSPAPKTTTGAKNSIVGLWCHYIVETSGYYNGLPQVTAGYFRREYLFKGDGTYIYRAKDWSVFVADILFIYEYGTWKINGNQLTIIPAKGVGEWWGKSASNRTSEWGTRKKSSDYKPETATYTFELRYLEGTKETHLFLKNSRRTSRDQPSGQDSKNIESTFTVRELDKSLIDNPPGFKPGTGNKTSAVPAINSNSVNSLLTGKIWEGVSPEKFSATGGSISYHTGGFSSMQYLFNANGTYRFIAVKASHYTDTKTLGHETGNWQVNGNQLTINPSKGQNEEWSKTGKTSNGNSEKTNRAINDTWNKMLRSKPRKLEKYTYSFSIGKNGENTALILQREGRTEREGEGSISYLNETSPGKTISLPAGVK